MADYHDKGLQSGGYYVALSEGIRENLVTMGAAEWPIIMTDEI